MMKKTVEHTETDRRHSEKIHRRNGFPMIAQESEPAFGRLGISRSTLHPAGNRSLRNRKTQHQKFSVYTRCAPSWVVSDHPKDQLANVLRRLSSSNLPPNSGRIVAIAQVGERVPPDRAIDILSFPCPTLAGHPCSSFTRLVAVLTRPNANRTECDFRAAFS